MPASSAASSSAAPGLRRDDRDDAFAEIAVRRADHRRFLHAGLLVEQHLDLLRIDVVAARDHQVLGAADDRDIAVGIDLAEIAGDEEAVGRNSSRVFSGMFQ